MKHRLLQLLIVSTLILSVGGHWAFLQTLAWGRMLVSYTGGAPISVDIEKTFDGNHPCDLCKLVKEGREADAEQDWLKPIPRFDWILADGVQAQPWGGRLAHGPVCVRIFYTRSEPPPLPPPLDCASV